MLIQTQLRNTGSNSMPSCTRLKPLEQGAVFGVFNPAREITDERAKFVRAGACRLRSWGFGVDPDFNGKLEDWKTLAPAEYRANEFNALILDGKMDAVIAAWAGSRTHEIVRLVNYDNVRAAGKPIFGYGDNCVLLNQISLSTGCCTFYGPNYLGKLNLISDGKRPLDNICSLSQIFFSRDVEDIVGGTAYGRLVGGSLRSFLSHFSAAHTLGADQSPLILFFETSSLDLLGLKRALQTSLRRTLGDSLRGILIGRCRNIARGELTQCMRNLFGCGLPILKCNDFGHSESSNPVLPIGANVVLDTANASMRVESEIFGHEGR